MVVVTDPNLLMLTIASSLVTASQGQSAAGVFLLMEYETYSFNFTAASTACHSHHGTMATAANVEEALRHGLETCKFGWVAEQVAVIPRRTVSSRCGNGKTGLVKWYARLDQAFGVFCFSATAAPQISTSVSATSTTLFTTTPVIPPHPSSTAISSSSPATTTKVPLSWISHLAHISTSSTPLPYHASYSPSSAHPLPSHVITSSLSSSTSAQTYASNQQMPTKPPQKAFWAVLIILGVAFLMVTVTGVLCYYYRLKNEPFRSRALQGDDVEAEMWKPTNSRTAINHPLNEDHEEEEEEEERDAKYSSDIMLCVNPQLRSGNNTIS
ncbi:lymphatic vessel endothelial hyaluronic receptor 1b isoform X3 [Corythoichthys intestinalis]|uniref:lymphatic vessel endothelial hyaluronic receptor 1b isoform X3 n=1 Tax=Corythoichthys intestinalis TaxID=161448 RepID=UPI0025A5213D|nr:lymphatic vessel endothelial hyaluronic receptor 1b isoform X3 [Corythoichthys intestinalis]